MAPRHSHLASCGDDKAKRRPSLVAGSSALLLAEMSDEFKKWDKRGTGYLGKDELRSFVTSLVALNDPINDIDAICARIDQDNNQRICEAEFRDFIAHTIAKFEQEHRLLECDEILREAFKEVIAESKKERDMVIEAFMTSSHEVPKDLIKGSKWMHEAYEELYAAPAAEGAPIYQANRVGFLKEALKRSIDECDKDDDKKPSLAGRSFDDAPDKKTFSQFCSLWLGKISNLEASLKPGWPKFRAEGGASAASSDLVG